MRSPLSIGILLAVVIVGFLSFFLRTTEGPAPVEPPPSLPLITDLISTVSYKSGIYAMKGSAVVPTRCISLSAQASVDASSTPAIIRVDLTAPIDPQTCLALPTEHPFEVSAPAPEGAVVVYYGNGVVLTPATTTP